MQNIDTNEVPTLITISEQIGCSETDMENAFGKKWVNILELKIPSSCRRNFSLELLITILSVFDDQSQSSTPFWHNLATHNYFSRESERLRQLIIRKSGTNNQILIKIISEEPTSLIKNNQHENQRDQGKTENEEQDSTVQKFVFTAKVKDGSLVFEEKISLKNGDVSNSKSKEIS